MSSQINSKDLVVESVFKPLRDDMDLAIKKSKELSDGLLIVMKTQADIANSTKKSAAGYRELAQAEERSKKALSEKEKMDQRILNLQKQSTQVTKAQRLAQAELATEIQRRNKIAKDEARATNQNFSAYQKLTIQIDKLTAEYRDLLVVEGKETAQTRKMRDEILRMNAVRNKANETLGMHQNKVGQYERALNGLNRTLGHLGLAFGVFQVLRNTFGIISASEDAFASLSAITGLTGDKFDVFKGAIMNTADELKVSGTVVAEAAEKIASAQPALLEDADALAAVTKEAITLNKAIKGDLTETSMALVGVMNQFSLGAEDASRVINVLAAGSQAGAATVNQINESMVKFGTTAKLMNISVEESVGAIETLGEKTIFGADAGTALRNILLKMSSIDVLPEKAMKQLEKYGVDTSIVKDETLSFEERLKELSKVAGDSTAIMQIFGTENATAATVLLNNLGTYDKMTEAVTGTNVAQEQAAINSDTLSNVIQELRAAWENLVIKWSEGTDVAGGLKAILRFLAENLETIVGVVLKAISSWAAYKVILKSWNSEGTGIIQTLVKMIKPIKSTGDATQDAALKANKAKISFNAFAGVISLLLPYLIEAGIELYNMFTQTSALEDVTVELTKKMNEEKAEMELLYRQILDTTAGSKDRQKVLDEINDKYGITLQNISDETLFMNRLAAAYRATVAEMEKKIEVELLQEKLKELIKKRMELEQATSEDVSWWNPTEMIGKGFGMDELENVKTDITEIENRLFSLNHGFNNLGAKGKSQVLMGETVEEKQAESDKKVGIQKAENDKLEALRKQHAQRMLEFENSLIEKGVDRELIDEFLFDMRRDLYKEELDFITELNFKTTAEWDKTYNELLKMGDQYNARLKGQKINRLDSAFDEVEQTEVMWVELATKIEKDTKKIRDAIRESIQNAMDSIAEMMEANTALIDRQIEKQQAMLDASISREQELRDIARERGLDATESIDAEREAQKKARREIEALEAKKRQLEMMIAAMKLLADGKSLGEIKQNLTDIKGFVEGSFYEGTDTTIADALGRTGTKDGHIVRVDDNEAVFNPAQTHALGIGKGGNTTQDIVDWYKNSIRLGQPQLAMMPSMQSDKALINRLDKLIKTTETIPSNMPKVDSVFNSQIGYFEWQTKTKRQSVKRRFYPGR